MPQVYVEVEESPNCSYFPMQVFEARGAEQQASELVVPEVSGARGPHAICGWCSEDGGSPCPVRWVEVGDSGAGTSLLVVGGDFGIRLKPAGSKAHWRPDDPAQWGEPYMLLDPDIEVSPR